MQFINQKNLKWWVLFSISACLAIVYLDQTGVALTLDAMQKSLGLSGLAIEWVVNAYLLTLAVFMLLGGRLADTFGHRKIFLIGMTFFLISSICCALSNSGWEIIISRSFQGFGGAFLIPTSIVLIAKSVELHERGKMIGICISFASVFLAFGPTIGGLLTQFWSWRLLFWLNVPIGLICILLTTLTVSAVKEENHSPTIDWFGFAALAISLTSLIVAFMQVTFWGWSSLLIVSLFVSFIIFLSLFLFIESKVKSPLINLHLFKNKVFSGGNAVLFLLQTCHVSSAVFWVLYLQNVLGYSAGKAGLFILPVTIPVLFCAQTSGRLLDRYGPRVPISIGMGLSTLGVLWVAIFANYYNYSLLFLGFLLYGIGAPLVIPAAVTSIISSVSAKDHGMASGIANTMRQIGGAFGLSFIGVIIANTQHFNLNHLLSQQVAYAGAFSYGMIAAAFFAFFAFTIALIVFKERKEITLSSERTHEQKNTVIDSDIP